MANYMKINNLTKRQVLQYQGVNATAREGVCEQSQNHSRKVVKAFAKGRDCIFYQLSRVKPLILGVT